MLLADLKKIGEKLYTFRKASGLTQEETAEKASVSVRTYADIERGTVNMRVETLVSICRALDITPNDILTEEPPELKVQYEDVMSVLQSKGDRVQENALDLLSVYLRSIE